MTWLRRHGWEWALGTTVHTLWFWPLRVVSVSTADYQIACNPVTRDEP